MEARALNVSQFCENALKEGIQKLKGPTQATNGGKSFLGPASFVKEGGLVGRTGLEPVTFCTLGRKPNDRILNIFAYSGIGKSTL